VTTLVYLDNCVFLDFANPKRDKIFYILIEFFNFCSSCSKFCTTDFIWENELKSIKQDYKEILENFLIIDTTPEEFILEEPPPHIDLGEWSVYLAIQTKERNCCVLCNDKKARDFFQRNNLLPCKHINPCVGGTLGILNFAEKHNFLPLSKTEIVEIMNEHGSWLPQVF